MDWLLSNPLPGESRGGVCQYEAGILISGMRQSSV